MASHTNGVPRVVLLGRTNVGKSTFFTRMSGQPALTSSTPNTTRDAKEAQVEWQGKTFLLIDTGGFNIERTDPLHIDVTARIGRELKTATHILFMTDNPAFLTDEEKRWVHGLHAHTPMTIIVNKADKPFMRQRDPHIHYKGIKVFPVSSTNGGGTGDVLDYLVESFKKNSVELPHIAFRLGLIGRTNVGKSSLVNALANEDRSIVNSHDHTTREPLAVTVFRKGQAIEVIDTAGAQKRPKQQIHIESQEVSLKAIATCDVIALVTEARTFPIPAQDIELAHSALEMGKSLMIIVNKWDTNPDTSSRGEREERKKILRALPQLQFVPIIMASAKTQSHIPRILDTAAKVYLERFVMLAKKDVRSIQQRLSKHVWLVEQLAVDPPRFHAIGTEKSIPRAINDIFHKLIRETYPFLGTPLKLSIAKRNAVHAAHNRPGQSR